MHVDFEQSVNNLPKMSDFCIVGSGPAGMTLALELERNGRSVILLEGGGHYPTEESQDIYKGDIIGDPTFTLDYSRLRYLGGTSGHWLGDCRPLDQIDFQKKKGFEDAHWPIDKKDLDPFLEKALSILELSPPRKDVMIDRDFGIKEVAFSFSSPPVRFGQKYLERLNSSNNVTYVTNANLMGLDTDGQRVSGAHIRNFAGQSASVNAKHFILAMGGIENSRMLLWCNIQAKEKLVDPRASLGRYWMIHPHVVLGSALVDLKFTMTGHSSTEFMLGLSDAAKRKLSVLNCLIILNELHVEGTKGLLRDLLCVAPTIGEWAASLVGKNPRCGVILRAAWEQEPIWNNQVKLSASKRDRFGIPLTELHWRKTDRDLATIRKTTFHFNDFLLSENRGRLKLDDWVFGKDSYPTTSEWGGVHQMGGTRMANTVEKGVVDSNCRVFGQENLFVAGSSVFPACGYANPTLTIVQLSLRLAEHLRSA